MVTCESGWLGCGFCLFVFSASPLLFPAFKTIFDGGYIRKYNSLLEGRLVFLQNRNPPKSVRFISNYSLWINTVNFASALLTFAWTIHCPPKKAKLTPRSGCVEDGGLRGRIVCVCYRNVNPSPLIYAVEKLYIRNGTTFSYCWSQYYSFIDVSGKKKISEARVKMVKARWRRKTEFFPHLFIILKSVLQDGI